MWILFDNKPINIFDITYVSPILSKYDTNSDKFKEVYDKLGYSMNISDNHDILALYPSEYDELVDELSKTDVPYFYCFEFRHKEKRIKTPVYHSKEYAQQKLDEFLTLINKTVAELPKFEA